MIEIMELIVKNKEDFMYSIQRRMNSSTYNKESHQKMFNYMASEDYSSVQSMVEDEWYAKPLFGVIVCSDINKEDKRRMLELTGGW